MCEIISLHGLAPTWVNEVSSHNAFYGMCTATVHSRIEPLLTCTIRTWYKKTKEQHHVNTR